MKYFLSLTLLFICTFAKAADKQDATVFVYDEKEAGTDVMRVRYIITPDFMRIDEGRANDDFVLYDIKKNKLYNVNHEDKTIMFIDYQQWKMPEKLGRKVIEKTLPEAPKVAGKTISQYHLLAKDKICSEVQFIPELYKDERAILHRYQNLLSGQLVSSLSNTPEEMRTDCMLVDQVYNTGELYDKGLPIQEQHSSGYVKVLVNFTHQLVDKSLFKLPEGYRQYQPFQGVE